MSYYFGMNNNSISSLFGSMNDSSSSFGNMSFISDYASIRNGSYGKLLRAHYNGISSQEKTSSSKTSTTDKTNEKDTKSKKQAVSVRDAAADLKSSANKLTSKSSELYKKKTVAAKDGKKTEEYDMKALYKAVKSFVDDYNSTIEAAGNSNNNSVLRRATNMVSVTNANKSLLDDVGISVSSTNKLSIDEDVFNKSDINDIKALFQGNGSYAYQMSSSASSIINASNTEIAHLSGSLYNSTGYYGSGSYSGSFYSDYF